MDLHLSLTTGLKKQNRPDLPGLSPEQVAEWIKWAKAEAKDPPFKGVRGMFKRS